MSTEVLEERVKKIGKEIKEIRRFLETLVKIELDTLKKEEPTDAEKKIFSEPKEEDYLDWESAKNEV